MPLDSLNKTNMKSIVEVNVKIAYFWVEIGKNVHAYFLTNEGAVLWEFMFKFWRPTSVSWWLYGLIYKTYRGASFVSVL